MAYIPSLRPEIIWLNLDANCWKNCVSKIIASEILQVHGRTHGRTNKHDHNGRRKKKTIRSRTVTKNNKKKWGKRRTRRWEKVKKEMAARMKKMNRARRNGKAR